MTGGTRAGYATAGGICLGLLMWGVAVAVGISALLTASRVAYDVLRYAGAAYMVFLGIKLIWHRRPRVVHETVEVPGAGKTTLRANFMRGFLTNLLNPKIGVFYVAILPQFLPADAPGVVGGFVLSSVHVAETLVWFSVLILGSQLLRSQFQRPGVQAWTDRITGGALIGFGTKVALTRV